MTARRNRFTALSWGSSSPTATCAGEAEVHTESRWMPQGTLSVVCPSAMLPVAALPDVEVGGAWESEWDRGRTIWRPAMSELCERAERQRTTGFATRVACIRVLFRTPGPEREPPPYLSSR